MKLISIIALIILLALTTTSCKKENRESVSNSSLISQSDTDKMSNDDYKLMRDLFVSQYKGTVSDIQKTVSTFDGSDEWWGEFSVEHQTLEDISDGFLKTEQSVSDENKSDFETIKQIVGQYADAINKISSVNGKSADEQTTIIAETGNTINQANAQWSEKIKVEMQDSE